MNWPGSAFLATNGASMTILVTVGFRRSFSMILYMHSPPVDIGKSGDAPDRLPNKFRHDARFSLQKMGRTAEYSVGSDAAKGGRAQASPPVHAVRAIRSRSRGRSSRRGAASPSPPGSAGAGWSRCRRRRSRSWRSPAGARGTPSPARSPARRDSCPRRSS